LISSGGSSLIILLWLSGMVIVFCVVDVKEWNRVIDQSEVAMIEGAQGFHCHSIRAFTRT
jgi:hypothetical protein